MGREELEFAALATSPDAIAGTKLAILSLRRFGGRLGRSPVAVYATGDLAASAALEPIPDVEFIRLEPDESCMSYPLGAKVLACARAERRAADSSSSVVWLSAGCLVLASPRSFCLGPDADIALRPVHHRNIGLRTEDPVDAYWQAVYDLVGRPDTAVESFVEGEELRPYYNTHCFSFNPRLNLMAEWLRLFKEMVRDEVFLSGPCSDGPHRIFLHQAVFSTLVATRLDSKRIRILPPTYSYPLHLHAQVPEKRRALSLDELILPVYEQTRDLDALAASGPLRSWLAGTLGGIADS